MNKRLHSAFASPTAGFVLRTAAWIVLLFGALRLDRVQAGLLIPFASLQERLAATLTGRMETGVVVDQSCTGSDALALCLGASLAFPASWTRRLIGAAAGFLIITAANTVRIDWAPLSSRPAGTCSNWNRWRRRRWLTKSSETATCARFP